jgi:hypothetical protein
VERSCQSRHIAALRCARMKRGPAVQPKRKAEPRRRPCDLWEAVREPADSIAPGDGLVAS